MPTSNPHVEVRSLRPKSAREQLFAQIAAECGAAWKAAREGQQHPRHYDSLESRRRAETARMAKESAFFPELPQIIVTTPPVQRDAYSDYLDRHHGSGGAERQE